MANTKKTQAQRAASTTGGKKEVNTSKGKNAAKSEGKAAETKVADERRIPIRFITAAVFLGLFPSLLCCICLRSMRSVVNAR